MYNLTKKLFKKSELFTLLYDGSKQFYNKYFVSDINLVKKQFKKKLGRDLQLANPQKYNDKIQWLKLHWNDPLATICADKFEVRRYVTEKIGAEYLNEIYGVYSSVKEIELDRLPNSFVLKGTHGSGFNIICKEKKNMDWNHEYKKINRWLRRDYYLSKRESVYRGIKPRIICEKFLDQGNDKELRDYRFFCFNGEPKFISVDFSITDKEKTRRNIYDLEWNLMDIEISYKKELHLTVEKPEKLNEMIELSKKLSSNFPHARIDFYYIENRIIFGEITFFHQSGMAKIKPEQFERTMGDWLKLPQ